MRIIISAFVITLSTFTTYAQADINEYLKTHHYAFTLDKGFDKPTIDTLKQKISGYKLILQAEGGSHYLNFYTSLPLVWIKFLHSNFGLTDFFFEAGHTSEILLNKYLQTGDTSYIFVSNKTFWQSLYTYAINLPANDKLKYFGVDFESRQIYLRAIKLMLPVAVPPARIKSSIDLVKNAVDTLKDCDYIISVNTTLKKALLNHQEDFVQYFGKEYPDFEKIVLNNGNCNDTYKDRNKNMASNFLSFDKEFNKSIYYGQLGEAHTVLINKNTASIINNSDQFKGKVCVVNLYCHNCTTTKENVSNWPLKKIEKDIVEYFLPFCNSDFTLFDLSNNSEITKKYRAYGQFLIIAKNQN